MKRIYCDICGEKIDNPANANRLIVPVWNKKAAVSVMTEYSDVCQDCIDDIAIYVDAMVHTIHQYDDKKTNAATAKWHSVSECPAADGRYLVADYRLTVSGRPHVSIAMYSRDDDEWATNALIHPEDIICWTEIPETPDRFFKPEKDDLIEENGQ